MKLYLVLSVAAYIISVSSASRTNLVGDDCSKYPSVVSSESEEDCSKYPEEDCRKYAEEDCSKYPEENCSKYPKDNEPKLDESVEIKPLQEVAAKCDKVELESVEPSEESSEESILEPKKTTGSNIVDLLVKYLPLEYAEEDCTKCLEGEKVRSFSEVITGRKIVMSRNVRMAPLLVLLLAFVMMFFASSQVPFA